jgi:prepilin signal peptidase PulO-like enzyme (type II secretory pathway)
MLLNFSLTLPVWWLGRLADQFGIQEIFLGLSIVVLLQGIIMIKQIPHLEKTVP